MRLALLLLLAPTVAFADGSFEVLDRGNAVEVIAHNVTAAKTGVLPIRSRLEVPLAGHPHAAALAPKDPTVKVVELEDGNLSVKVGFEHPAVIGLAKFAQASQIGPDVHLIFPRIVPATGAAIVMPEPTIPVELAKTIPTPEIVAPKLTPDIVPPKQVQELTPSAKVTPDVAKPAPEVVAAAPAAPPVKLTPDVAKSAKSVAKTPEPDDAWSKLAMYGAIGLAGLGCGGYLLKKKRASQGPVSTIDVIAQKSLGGKARVVWFAAGGREMVVAVTPQAVRMLGQWDASAKPALPVAQTSSSKAPSAAVSGILKLREKAGPAFSSFNDDVATGDIDADALWAKEIMAATGAKR